MTNCKKFLRTAYGSLVCFTLACDAFAATEFAIISPAMISMLFGATEVSQAYSADGKVSAVAAAAGDLVAQETAVCNAEMTDIFAALDAIIYPYATTDLSVAISSIVDGGGGTVKVAWSDAKNGSARATNSLVSIPAGLMPAGGSLIMAEVSYNYSSTAGHLIYGTISLQDKVYFHPRRAITISRSAASC